jgi:ATP adenylyltransferase
MALDRFDQLARGLDCPLCLPRAESNDEWDLVAALSASSFYLAKDQTYRGRAMLIFDLRHAARLDQLSPDEWRAFSGDLYLAQHAIVGVCQPEHINVESLGNVVPHLHWHLIPRYRDDPQWGAPIWTAEPPKRLLDDGDREALQSALQRALTAAPSGVGARE